MCLLFFLFDLPCMNISSSIPGQTRIETCIGPGSTVHPISYPSEPSRFGNLRFGSWKYLSRRSRSILTCLTILHTGDTGLRRDLRQLPSQWIPVAFVKRSMQMPDARDNDRNNERVNDEDKERDENDDRDDDGDDDGDNKRSRNVVERERLPRGSSIQLASPYYYGRHPSPMQTSTVFVSRCVLGKFSSVSSRHSRHEKGNKAHSSALPTRLKFP